MKNTRVHFNFVVHRHENINKLPRGILGETVYYNTHTIVWESTTQIANNMLNNLARWGEKP